MTTSERSVEEIVEELLETLNGWSCETGEYSSEWVYEAGDVRDLLTQTLQAERQRCEEMVEAERERINQFFAVKADYDTDSDCVIITDKVYHQAFFPDGCGSDGQDGRNRCEDCYKYRTKFGQNVLAKLEPNQSELDQLK